MTLTVLLAVSFWTVIVVTHMLPVNYKLSQMICNKASEGSGEDCDNRHSAMARYRHRATPSYFLRCWVVAPPWSCCYFFRPAVAFMYISLMVAYCLSLEASGRRKNSPHVATNLSVDHIFQLQAQPHIPARRRGRVADNQDEIR